MKNTTIIVAAFITVSGGLAAGLMLGGGLSSERQKDIAREITQESSLRSSGIPDPQCRTDREFRQRGDHTYRTDVHCRSGDVRVTKTVHIMVDGEEVGWQLVD